MGNTRGSKAGRNVINNAGGRAGKQRRLTAAEIDAQIPAARTREAAARRAGMRAQSAHYDTGQKRIIIQLTNGYLIGIPEHSLPELAGASLIDLARVEVSPSGSGLHWAALDMDLSVPALVLSAIPSADRMREMGRIAGRAKTEAKAAASRANGAKGGRPRAKERLD